MAIVGSVPSGFFGMWDLSFLEPGICDFKEIWKEDSALLWSGIQEIVALKRWDPGFQMVKILLSYLQPPLWKNPGSTPAVLGDRRNIEDTCACYTGYNNITMRLGHHNVM